MQCLKNVIFTNLQREHLRIQNDAVLDTMEQAARGNFEM